MIWCDVEHDRHAGLEGLDGLELERRDLGHHEAIGGKVECARGERRADVAADEDRTRLLREQCAGERGRRRLAVGPRDGDRLGLHRTPRQLELADDRHATRAHGRELRAVQRHAGADDDQLDAVEGRGAVDEPHAESAERGDLRTERGDGLGVGATHVGAGGGEQAGGGDPALGETDDGYPTLGQRRQVRAPSRPHLHLLRQEAHALLPMLALDGGAPAPRRLAARTTASAASAS